MQLAADVRKEKLRRKQTVLYAPKEQNPHDTELIAPKVVYKVGQVLATQQTGRELDLRKFVDGLSNDLLWELGQELPECVSLNCAGWQDITETSIRSISLGFGNRLEILDLSNSSITPSVLKTLSIRLFAIRNLKLSSCKHLNNQSCKFVAEGCGRTITNLDYSRCPKVDQGGAQWLAGTVGAGVPCKILQAISFAECPRLTDVALQSLGSGCTQLRYANFAKCSLVSDKGVADLAKGCSSLRVLNLQHCALVGNKSLAALGQYCQQLRSLNVSMCTSISDTGLRALTKGKVSLQSLNIAGCREVSETGVFFVASNSKGMQLMNVTGCDLVTQRGLSEMLRGLPFVEMADSFTGFKAKETATRLKLQAQIEVVRSHSACRITALFRGVATRRQLQQSRTRQTRKRSATRVQSWYRGILAKRVFNQLCQTQRELECAIRLQCAWRCKSARNKVARIPFEVEAMIRLGQVGLKVQAVYRGNRCRKENPEVIQVRNALYDQRTREVRAAIAVRLQSIARSRRSNKRFKAQREEFQQRRGDMHLAAKRIQGLSRQFVAKLAVERQKEYNIRRYSMVNAAASNIQKVYRAKVGRRRFFKFLKEHHAKVAREQKAANDIQRVYRAYSVRNTLHAIFEQREKRVRAAIMLQKVYRKRLAVDWQELRFQMLKQQIEQKRLDDELNSAAAVSAKNQERIDKVNQDSASEEEGEDEEDDWQEHWDYDAGRSFFYSPSRAERSWEKPILREFEKSLITCHVRIYWPHDQFWYTGTLSRYNKTKNKHRIEYEDDDHEWLDLKAHEERVQIYNSDEQQWEMFKVFRKAHQAALQVAATQSLQVSQPATVPGYYSNTELPEPWRLYEDPNSGLPYYYNTATGHTTWHIEEIYQQL